MENELRELTVKRDGSGYRLWWSGFTLKISKKCYKRWGGDSRSLLNLIKNHYSKGWGDVV